VLPGDVDDASRIPLALAEPVREEHLLVGDRDVPAFSSAIETFPPSRR